jgi:predicted RNA methylase
MNLWIQQSPIGVGNGSAQTALTWLNHLKAITNKLPTQTKRTEEQDEWQQFSTVPALAYMANWVANVQPGETMLEPSAGIGGLAVFAKTMGANVVANELSSRRAAILREVLPDARVFTENAEHINDVLPDDVKPTVVVMNPPFSATAGRMRASATTQSARSTCYSALQRLQPGGRLVAIVGEGMAMDAPGIRAWWGEGEGRVQRARQRARRRHRVREVRHHLQQPPAGHRQAGPTTTPVVEGGSKSYAELPALLEGSAMDEPLPSASSLTLNSKPPNSAAGLLLPPEWQDPIS